MSCFMVGTSNSQSEEFSLKDLYIVIGGPGSRKEYFCRSLACSSNGLGYYNFSDAEEDTYKSDASKASALEPPQYLLQRSLLALRQAMINSRQDRILL